MVNCLFITSGLCWKTTTQLGSTSAPIQTLWASGNCLPCLMGMRTFGYTNNMIEILGNGMELMSGARVQYVL